ncbi:ABC transporter permease [Roseivirga sp.]|uniref:ABC transporter permease n=1 Tax=Roseivirga sp. TaxID=1964215 RepID=UPI002B265715|nr:ABC transporter permease [Roseivirga sp.]
MLRNYIKVAFRNLRRNKLYAGLNILGLSIGLGSFFIIYLFLQNELAYDQFHEKKDRVYRVVQTIESDFGVEKEANMSYAFSPEFVESIPGIEAFSRVIQKPVPLSFNEGSEGESGIGALIVDPEFLDFFTLDYIYGTNETVLKSPNSVLISESTAMRFYGTSDALGQVINYNKVNYVVDGVFHDLPNSSSIKGDVIMLNEIIHARYGQGSWSWNVGAQCYLLLEEGTNISDLKEKLTQHYTSNNKWAKGKKLTLQPITDVHYSLDVRDKVFEKTDRQYVSIFAYVAIFILVSSVFNYISLAVSQSIVRAKEIGVRKVTGASKLELGKQFILESLLHVFISFVIAMILVELLIPQLEGLIERDLGISVLAQPVLLVKGIVFSMVNAIVCSFYPTYLSTRLKVVNVFKNGKGSFSSQRLIGTIGVFQIVVFVVLICVSVTANRQMRFMRNENLGFDKDHQLVLEYIPWRTREVYKNELLKLPGVKSVSSGSQLPNDVVSSTGFYGSDVKFSFFEIDHDYIQTMGMDLLSGRNFVIEDLDSSRLIMINATAAKKLGYDEVTAVGKTVGSASSPFTIIGVVSDFHFASKKELIEPVVFRQYTEGSNNQFLVKLDDANWASTSKRVLDVYNKIPNLSRSSFFFFEDRIDAQYKQENVMITMLNTFTVIAALVAFIGLFGIAGYSVKRRLKEMGIRKVLGAGFLSIQKTLNVSSVWKLLIAVAIAVPVVLYWMDNWLSSFAYRIEMPVFLIFGAIAVASIVIFLTVSIHSIKAYLINPVEILKDE